MLSFAVSLALLFDCMPSCLELRFLVAINRKQQQLKLWKGEFLREHCHPWNAKAAGPLHWKKKFETQAVFSPPPPSSPPLFFLCIFHSVWPCFFRFLSFSDASSLFPSLVSPSFDFSPFHSLYHSPSLIFPSTGFLCFSISIVKPSPWLIL